MTWCTVYVHIQTHTNSGSFKLYWSWHFFVLCILYLDPSSFSTSLAFITVVSLKRYCRKVAIFISIYSIYQQVWTWELKIRRTKSRKGILFLFCFVLTKKRKVGTAPRLLFGGRTCLPQLKYHGSDSARRGLAQLGGGLRWHHRQCGHMKGSVGEAGGQVVPLLPAAPVCSVRTLAVAEWQRLFVLSCLSPLIWPPSSAVASSPGPKKTCVRPRPAAVSEAWLFVLLWVVWLLHSFLLFFSLFFLFKSHSLKKNCGAWKRGTWLLN